MTLGDVAVKVVTEITLDPEDQVRDVLKLAFGNADRHSAFTDDISNKEAMQIYSHLRKDPSDILRLYASGKKAIRDS